jgi:hypothetical protein
MAAITECKKALTASDDLNLAATSGSRITATTFRHLLGEAIRLSPAVIEEILLLHGIAQGVTLMGWRFSHSHHAHGVLLYGR